MYVWYRGNIVCTCLVSNLCFVSMWKTDNAEARAKNIKDGGEREEISQGVAGSNSRKKKKIS